MKELVRRTITSELCHQVDAGIPQAEMERHIRYLCEQIGVRMPGTPEEQLSADYCANVIQDLGYEVEIEQVSYMAWAADGTRVEMVAPQAKPLRATWFSYTLPTPPEGIRAPVAYVGMENEEDWSEASGRIAIVGRKITTSPGRRDFIGRAHAAGAVGYLEFCTAIPSNLPKVGNAASFFTGRREPLMPSDLPPLPAASISVDDVEEIRRLLAAGNSVDLRLVIGPKDGKLLVWRTSPNVIGTVHGTDLADEIVYIIGHHDANVIGAHDNASGVASVLATARWLKESGHRPRRTIRLFMPGCEQFGLVGSTVHVNQNPDVMARTVFAMDWGAVGDGDAMWVDRTPDTATLFDHVLASTGYAQRIPTVTQAPAVASDHAGFLWRAGIPACELHFREFQYLFTIYDDPAHINMDRARQSAVLGALAALAFANQGPLPLDFAGCATELRQTIQKLSSYDTGLYRGADLVAAVDDLGVIGSQINSLATRIAGDRSRLSALNLALRAASRMVDPRLTGEFKLLPVLQRLLTDHQEVTALGRHMPRRLVEQTNVLQKIVIQRDLLVTEIQTESSGAISAINEATNALRQALA